MPGIARRVVIDGNPDQARHWCDALLDMAWAQRAAFVYPIVYPIEPLADSMARAQTLAAAKPAGCTATRGRCSAVS